RKVISKGKEKYRAIRRAVKRVARKKGEKPHGSSHGCGRGRAAGPDSCGHPGGGGVRPLERLSKGRPPPSSKFPTVRSCARPRSQAEQRAGKRPLAATERPHPMASVRVLILRAPGANCDGEAQFAFELAGAAPERVHVNRIRERPQLLRQYQILVLPGGF